MNQYPPEIIRYAREAVGALIDVTQHLCPEDVGLILAIFIEAEDGFTLSSIDDKPGPWVTIDDATKSAYNRFAGHSLEWFLEKRKSLIRLTDRPHCLIEHAESEGIDHFRLTAKGHQLIETFLAPGSALLTETTIED